MVGNLVDTDFADLVVDVLDAGNAFLEDEFSDDFGAFSFGEVVSVFAVQGEDFFGRSVILAARIASQALGGQILVSSLLKALVESTGAFEFSEGRDVELKGLTGTHQVVDVKWNEKA